MIHIRAFDKGKVEEFFRQMRIDQSRLNQGAVDLCPLERSSKALAFPDGEVAHPPPNLPFDFALDPDSRFGLSFRSLGHDFSRKVFVEVAHFSFQHVFNARVGGRH